VSDVPPCSGSADTLPHRLHRVRVGILGNDPAFRVTPQEYPKLLWRDGVFDPEDPHLGFLQSMLLVKVRGSVQFTLQTLLRNLA